MHFVLSLGSERGRDRPAARRRRPRRHRGADVAVVIGEKQIDAPSGEERHNRMVAREAAFRDPQAMALARAERAQGEVGRVAREQDNLD
jgi:hypothetical protein